MELIDKLFSAIDANEDGTITKEARFPLAFSHVFITVSHVPRILARGRLKSSCNGAQAFMYMVSSGALEKIELEDLRNEMEKEK